MVAAPRLRKTATMVSGVQSFNMTENAGETEDAYPGRMRQMSG